QHSRSIVFHVRSVQSGAPTTRSCHVPTPVSASMSSAVRVHSHQRGGGTAGGTRWSPVPSRSALLVLLPLALGTARPRGTAEGEREDHLGCVVSDDPRPASDLPH